MGTRSLTHIKDSDRNTLVTIYRQYDGYPNGMGQDIKAQLYNGKAQIINGFCGQKSPEYFNGMECLAAYLVGALKGKSIGNVYIYPRDAEAVGEEYIYVLYEKEEKIFIQVEGHGDILFDGPLDKFKPEELGKESD